MRFSSSRNRADTRALRADLQRKLNAGGTPEERLSRRRHIWREATHARQVALADVRAIRGEFAREFFRWFGVAYDATASSKAPEEFERDARRLRSYGIALMVVEFLVSLAFGFYAFTDPSYALAAALIMAGGLFFGVGPSTVSRWSATTPPLEREEAMKALSWRVGFLLLIAVAGGLGVRERVWFLMPLRPMLIALAAIAASMLSALFRKRAALYAVLVDLAAQEASRASDLRAFERLIDATELDTPGSDLQGGLGEVGPTRPEPRGPRGSEQGRPLAGDPSSLQTDPAPKRLIDPTRVASVLVLAAFLWPHVSTQAQTARSSMVPVVTAPLTAHAARVARCLLADDASGSVDTLTRSATADRVVAFMHDVAAHCLDRQWAVLRFTSDAYFVAPILTVRMPAGVASPCSAPTLTPDEKIYRELREQAVARAAASCAEDRTAQAARSDAAAAAVDQAVVHALTSTVVRRGPCTSLFDMIERAALDDFGLVVITTDGRDSCRKKKVQPLAPPSHRVVIVIVPPQGQLHNASAYVAERQRAINAFAPWATVVPLFGLTAARLSQGS